MRARQRARSGRGSGGRLRPPAGSRDRVPGGGPGGEGPLKLEGFLWNKQVKNDALWK